MKSRRSAAATMLGLVMVAGAMLFAPGASAAPAPAQPDNPSAVSAPAGARTAQDTSCNAGDLCFWVDINQKGAKGRVNGTNAAWGVFRQGTCQSGTWDNCASSIINNGRSCTARVWADGDFNGAALEVLRGNGYINLTDHYITWPIRNWNDEISSNDWINCG